MPVKHAFASAKVDGADTTKVRPSNWNADHLTPPFVLPLYLDGANLTLTNMVAGLTELNGNRSRLKVDLANVNEARISARVLTIGSASAALRVQYSTDESTWRYLDAAQGGPSVVIGGGAAGTRVSAWVTLEAGAKADVFLRLVSISGDGVADPALGAIYLQVR